MSSLVHHVLPPHVGEELMLDEGIRKDIVYAERRSPVPILGLLVRRRVQWFYVLGNGVSRPNELKRLEYRDIKESAIHLPATKQSRQKIEKAFKAHSDKCQFVEIHLNDCGKAKEGIIFYCIATRVNPKRR